MKGMRAWMRASLVVLGVPAVVACAAGSSSTGPEVHSFGAQPAADSAAGDDGSGGCSACSTDDATTSPPSQSSTPDGAGGAEDASAPPVGNEDSGTTPISLPPLTLPDGGLGGTPAPDDGGACTTKICVDPVFDCPLQGCFNGCTNFHCN
ncbi:MAG: hypothetical protein ACLP1X_26225 [Polyangiaceae bacterium]